MRLNKNGYEVFLVIVIIGLLVGISAAQKAIMNSRIDTFADTAHSYINSVNTAWDNDYLTCNGSKPSELNWRPGTHYQIPFATADKVFFNVDMGEYQKKLVNNANRLLSSGGKSPWGNSDVIGYVEVYETLGYRIYLFDEKGNTIIYNIGKEKLLQYPDTAVGSKQYQFSNEHTASFLLDYMYEEVSKLNCGCFFE